MPRPVRERTCSTAVPKVPGGHVSRLVQSVEPTAERPQERWWPALPWRTGAENPIVADHAD
jgi:hypothetical protein